MTVTVLRPANVVQNTPNLWTAVGAANIPTALNDNSDASYALAPVSVDNLLIVDTGTWTLPGSDVIIHRARVRFRGAIPSTVSVRGYAGNTGTKPFGAFTLSLSSTITDYVGPWSSTVFQGVHPLAYSTAWWWQVQKTAGANQSRIYEAYIDVDSRHAPVFTPEVQDAAGAPAGTITDTNIPRYVFGGIDYDDLPASGWVIDISSDPAGTYFERLSGNGTPPSVITGDSLANGSYTATFSIRSSVQGGFTTLLTSEVVSFDVAFTPPVPPAVTTTPTTSPPSVEVCWALDTPGVTDWDDDSALVIEIRRTDCNGTQTIHVAADTAGCHTDRFMSLTYSGVFCGESDHICQVCYEARYWGLVDDIIVSTDWSTPECETLTNPTPGNAWIRGGDSGDLSICPDESFGIAHPFGAFQPIAGGTPTVVTGAPGGRDYTLSIPVTSEADLVTLLAILGQAIVYYQPVAAADLWLSAMPRQIQITKVGRIRVVDVPFVAVNPQPQADPASLVT